MKDFDELYLKDKEYIADTYNRINLNIKYGDGSYLIDINNERYLDMYSGVSVNLAGQSEKSIIKAIIEQSNKYIHLSNNFICKPAVELAEILVKNTFAEKVFFTNSGTEANETAIKIARKYGKINGKTKILSAYNSFHGRTMGSLSLTAQAKYQESFRPLLADIDYFEYNNYIELENKISEDVSAVFIELIQGEGGIVVLEQNFLEKLCELSERYGFLIVVDEIQTGLGRTGKFLACEHFNIKPDIVTVSKGLGGGLPVGSALLGDRCKDILSKGEHGSTFAPNPVACAAGLAVLKIILNDSFLKDVNEKSKYIINRLKILKNLYPPIIKDVRGMGLMIGIDVGNFAQIIKEKAFENKLLLNTTANKVIRLLPALNISYEEIDRFIEIFANVVAEIK
jgi:acetylornithine/N-succinyldiaminopimelate aminotransferase